MKSAIDIFTNLGERLATFGLNELSSSAITQAVKTNEWFTPTDICRAVEAIRVGMLQRDKLEGWLSQYPSSDVMPRRVLVITAGNIPLVGFFDILCVVASGHRCLLKPSGKDVVLLGYIVELLKDIDADVPIELYDGRSDIDAVIATGSDNAAHSLNALYADVKSLVRGSRHSVAVLAGNETSTQLAALSDDIFAYSGLGCRNVSLLFVPRGYRLQIDMPTMNVKYHNNYLQTKALYTMIGTPFIDFGGAVAVESSEFSGALSALSYIYYDSLADVEMWLMEHDKELQCVVSQCVNHSRRVDFGCAQSPRLIDYPDDADVIAFLKSIK